MCVYLCVFLDVCACATSVCVCMHVFAQATQAALSEGNILHKDLINLVCDYIPRLDEHDTSLRFSDDETSESMLGEAPALRDESAGEQSLAMSTGESSTSL